MRSWLTIPAVLVAASAIAGCGSSKGTSTPTNPQGNAGSAGNGAAAGNLARRRFELNLSGRAEVPLGAPHGSARAVITINRKTERVCWKFTSMHGFAHPTAAHIHTGSMGTDGNVVVPLMPKAKFSPGGCILAPATVIDAILARPISYYVNIHSLKHPAGAVRAQL